MSYDEFLYERIALSLHRDPSSSLWKLSRELRVSQRTIERTVFTNSGKTFRDLSKEILVKRITAILASLPARPIKELSFDLGYNSASSFARAVKRACGSSPKELRWQIIYNLSASQNT